VATQATLRKWPREEGRVEPPIGGEKKMKKTGRNASVWRKRKGGRPKKGIGSGLLKEKTERKGRGKHKRAAPVRKRAGRGKRATTTRAMRIGK